MFLVIYEWRAKPGKDDLFREAWRRGTLAITTRYGSFGSRLCRADDGRFIGVAEWPDEASWRAAMSRDMEHDDLEAREMLVESVIDGGDPVLTLAVLDDLLRRPPSADSATPGAGC
jgi:heme-degrading monooxygenase HmoA